MEQYLWKQRPLLVFAKAEDEKLMGQHRAVAAAKEGVDERDMAVIEVAGDLVVTVAGPRCREGAGQLRAFAGVEPGEFRVVLVGKDGGIKLESAEQVPMERLFRLIDSMPMRRDEMARDST